MSKVKSGTGVTAKGDTLFNNPGGNPIWVFSFTNRCKMPHALTRIKEQLTNKISSLELSVAAYKKRQRTHQSHVDYAEGSLDAYRAVLEIVEKEIKEELGIKE